MCRIKLTDYPELSVIFAILALFTLAYGQNARVRVPADVTTETLILEPGAAPASADEGQIYYNSTDKKLYYYNGTIWQPIGQGDKTVATKIVAASNSNGTTCVGATCTNPKADYVCNGTADQGTINYAVNATGVNGGAVYLLEGTYNITSSINLDNTAPVVSTNKVIIGTGAGTVLRVTTGTSNVNVINASNVTGTLISQLMVDGNNQTGGNNNGIVFDNVSNSKINNVQVKSIDGIGISFVSSSNNTVSNSSSKLNSNNGIRLDHSSNNNVSGNNFSSAGSNAGIFLNTLNQNNIISNNIVRSNAGSGILVSNSSFNIIRNNNIASNSVHGILLMGSDSSNTSDSNIISGNNVESNGTDTTSHYGIRLGLANNNTVSANCLYGNKRGISIGDSSNNVVLNNLLTDNGDRGIQLLDLAGFIATTNNNLISSNLIYASSGSGYGVDISDSTCKNNYLVANYISGAGYSATPIDDSGTNTTYTGKEKLTWEPVNYPQITIDSFTISPAQPTSYLKLTSSGDRYSASGSDMAIANGTSAGDILMLENVGTRKITIKNSATTKLRSDRDLYPNDVLTLLWSNVTTDWLETGFADN